MLPVKVKKFLSATLVAFIGLLVSPTAVAAQPIDWTISQTIIGSKGEDLPLRVGQGDEPGSVGFGLSHIKDSPAVSFQPLQRLTQFYITPPTAKAA